MVKVEKIEKNQKAELIVIKTRVNDKARAQLAIAMLEDEELKRKSQDNSMAYLKRKEEESKIAQWVWNLVWFVMGILFTLSVDGLIWQLPVPVK